MALIRKMPEDVLYSEVLFVKEKGKAKGKTSTSDKSLYSEINISRKQPFTETTGVHVSSQGSAASQSAVSGRGSKVTLERLVLLLLCVLLSAAVVALGVVGFDHFRTKKTLQTREDEIISLRRNLTGGTNAKCERGWEQHGRMCYYFSKIRASWQESRDKCERLRGDLVKIESWEEQEFLDERLKEKMEYDEDKFWIGLTDSVQEGTWVWVDGSTLITSFWSMSEPDNWNKENPVGEDCVRMGEQGASNGLKIWFDRACNSPNKSICEKLAAVIEKADAEK
ncbi:galactose-specific lectin nattectin-like [Mastacembelus armatus]|uniref:galactose-specific lectin nattectin-like n=1 Tax=Mastacembelus armatus TaxID=205130 RepID=UPI000E4628B3|nr:galactose-specific lectin nattectin-like [Mastacembelus armatus]